MDNYSERDLFFEVADELKPVRIKLKQLLHFTRNSKFALKNLTIVGATLAEIDAEIVRILNENNLRYENQVELIRHFIQKPNFSEGDFKSLGNQLACAYVDLENISKKEGWFKEAEFDTY